MPGFTIDTRSDGADENGKPHVELYYSEDRPVSIIQRTAVEGIVEYDTVIYDVQEKMDKVHSRKVNMVPTTIALDEDYEISRWEKPTHIDEIYEVLDSW